MPFTQSLIANLIIWSTLILLIFILRLFKKQLIKYLDFFIAMTVWILLWMIFLWFLPEIIHSWLDEHKIGFFFLVWLFVFYIFELFLHHHHCKDLDCNKHDWHSNKTLMFAWTLIHNMLHWVIIFSAFTIWTEFGIATTIAILLHSIPQNTANYIMNHNKEFYVILAALWWILWALILFPFTDFLVWNKFIIISIISWALLYLALSDILPEFKNKWWLKMKLLYLLFIFAGLWLTIILNIH